MITRSRISPAGRDSRTIRGLPWTSAAAPAAQRPEQQRIRGFLMSGMGAPPGRRSHRIGLAGPETRHEMEADDGPGLPGGGAVLRFPARYLLRQADAARLDASALVRGLPGVRPVPAAPRARGGPGRGGRRLLSQP